LHPRGFAAAHARLMAKAHQTISPLERILGSVNRHVTNDEVDPSVTRYRIGLCTDVERSATENNQVGKPGNGIVSSGYSEGAADLDVVVSRIRRQFHHLSRGHYQLVRQIGSPGQVLG